MSATLGLVADVVPASCVDGPGNRFVVFLQGCSFNCLACHNPHTIPRHETTTSRWVPVADLVGEISHAAPFLSGVTVSGGEATCQWEFVRELFVRLGEHPATTRLDRLVDTNGDADPAVWDALAGCMDGAMVDLKAFDPDVHQFLTGRPNDRVLGSIHQLDRLGRLAEVRLLLVPGVNDHPSQLERTAVWLGGLRTAPTVAILGFRQHGTRPVAARFAEASDDDLDHAVETLVQSGIDPARIRTPSLRHSHRDSSR